MDHPDWQQKDSSEKYSTVIVELLTGVKSVSRHDDATGVVLLHANAVLLQTWQILSSN